MLSCFKYYPVNKKQNHLDRDLDLGVDPKFCSM